MSLHLHLGFCFPGLDRSRDRPFSWSQPDAHNNSNEQCNQLASGLIENEIEIHFQLDVK
jgi:hypothetical protein